MIRLSDLLAKEVRDGNGRPIGKVEDVLLVQEPDELEGGAPPLVLTDLVVSKPGRGRIHALVHPDINGPWSVKKLAGWMLRHSVLVPWSGVDEIGDTYVTLKAGAKRRKLHGSGATLEKGSAEHRGS